MDPLIDAARRVQSRAHVPYSGYRVGAALETDSGEVFTGANLEVSNYSNSMHAEALSVAAAVLAGRSSFERLAVSSGVREGVTPCGMCRQTLVEFCDEDLTVLCDEGDTVAEYTLGTLQPHAFRGESLTDE